MKILFLTIGDRSIASSRVRVHGYIPFLEKNGVSYRALSFTSPAGCRRELDMERGNILERAVEFFYKIFICSALLALSTCYDAIFIQKVILPRPLWNMLRRLNRNIIFDFDDAIFLEKDISSIIKGANGVFTSRNSFLKNYALKFTNNVTEIVSPIDVARYEAGNRIQKKEVAIGWIGTEYTSRYLGILRRVFERLGKIYDNILLITVGAPRAADVKGIRAVKKEWSEKNEPIDVARFDIGILPLFQDEWSRGKGGYKLFQYMSAGIPSVASDWGVNSSLIEDGRDGFLARNEDEWFTKLSLLIKDGNLRRRMGEEARKKAEREYSYEANFGIFYNALRKI